MHPSTICAVSEVSQLRFQDMVALIGRAQELVSSITRRCFGPACHVCM